MRTRKEIQARAEETQQKHWHNKRKRLALFKDKPQLKRTVMP